MLSAHNIAIVLGLLLFKYHQSFEKVEQASQDSEQWIQFSLQAFTDAVFQHGVCKIIIFGKNTISVGDFLTLQFFLAYLFASRMVLVMSLNYPQA